MNRILSLLALYLVVSTAQAGPINLATEPLLNIDGSGAVRPNLMLLYDDSGSMGSTYMPSQVADVTSCREKATMAGGTRKCAIGDPPYASADFNKQYYNPKIRYLPAIKKDGTSYPSMTAAQTSNWTAVPTDGIFTASHANGVNTFGMDGGYALTGNIAAKFPDAEFCDTGKTVCNRNTGYAYPNDDRYTVRTVQTTPYYYTINVAEYCSDATLKTCIATAVNAPAPKDYPFPARVRWCDTAALTNCQGKYTGNFIYPRFSSPNSAPDWFGTITIGASSTTDSVSIASVSVVEPNGTFVMTNGAVTASSGTDTLVKQYNMANDLAASIIAKKGLASQYTACVKTPKSTAVPACSSFNITLQNDNVVAIVPISCPGTTSKAVPYCRLLNDGSATGRDLIVTPNATATALVSVSGTANGTVNEVMSSITLDEIDVFPGKLVLPKGASALAVAQAIRDHINTGTAAKAYLGYTPGTPPACANAPSGYTLVCVVAPHIMAGQLPVFGTVTNNTKASGAYLGFGRAAASLYGVPVSVVPMGAAVFARTDIKVGGTYPKTEARTDCAGDNCTYAEEMTNFANWYAYYKTRNQMMKSSVGQAFQAIGEHYNVGIVALSTAAVNGGMTPPLQFTGTDRENWYTTLYDMNFAGATPLRPALHAVGKMYAYQDTYKVGTPAVQYPCQQNFTFITTDGYWNLGQAADVKNNDQVENTARFCSKAKGCVDPTPQAESSLADVALYWYNGGSNTSTVSLRDSIDKMTEKGQVGGGAGDNTHLHMKTYALGLGVDGVMTYDKNYETATSGDFYKLVTGATSGCPWNGGGAYVWPDLDLLTNDGSSEVQSRVDDLWHAAINGHGKYFSASNPLEVIGALRDALSHIEVKVGAAAAAATSTPNISQQDKDLFAATFTTVQWWGELQGREVDITTGRVKPGYNWSSSDTVGTTVHADKDERTIYMLDVDADPRVLKPFTSAAMTSKENDWFRGKCSQLPQCAALNKKDKETVDDPATMVNWLRGQQQYANNVLLRAYAKKNDVPLVLGDIASSKPAYLREPRKFYSGDKQYKGYEEFKTLKATRKPVVFVGANDGMLHAFAAASRNDDSGKELWAYAPRITMKKLYRQASTSYGGNHQFTVDGSPEVADVKIGNDWKTVLVAGLNGGGRGYYAIDVTDPENPAPLWELCADATVCTTSDENIGLTFGNPQFGTWKDGTGKEIWVVFLTSGYNNVKNVDGVDKGDGKSYLYVVDVNTGKILKKAVAEKAGDAPLTTPPGLARITAITDNPNTDALVTYVYGGDNLGRLWRFDFTGPYGPEGVTPVVTLMGEAGSLKPITTRPDVTQCLVTVTKDKKDVQEIRRVVAFGTGRLLDTSDVTSIDVQAAYALVDSGTALGSLDGAGLSERTLSVVPGTNTAYAISGDKVVLGKQPGWYVKFNLNQGERINLDPKIIDGIFGIVTNVPSSATGCQIGGTSNLYHIDVCTAAPVKTIEIADPAKPDFRIPQDIFGETLSNKAGAVGTIVISLPSGERKRDTTNAGGGVDTSDEPSPSSADAMRAGWRRVRN